MAHKLEMIVLLRGTGSPAHRKIASDIFSFATKHALVKIIHAFSCIYC